MTATIYGYNEYEEKKFNYTIKNIVSTCIILDTIMIQYIDNNGVPQSTHYNKDSVKIIIEN